MGIKTVFTTGEAAKICKVSQQTIIRCFDSGGLKGFRVPGSRFRRIPREHLYAFMKENNIPGRIVNISSVHGTISWVKRKFLPYCAAKGGLEMMTKALAVEVAKYGITVNCVAPGPTQTGWIDEELEKAVLPLIPMEKLIMPEDIAETILFLSSEQARMLTGQVIKVSGGHAL